MVRVLLTILLGVLAAPAYAQPFLYSVKPTPPCTTTGCASMRIVVTNARTGEVVNAEDPALLGPTAVNTPWLPAGRYHVALYGRRTATGNFDATSVVTIAAAGQSALMALDFPAVGNVVPAMSPDLFIAGWAGMEKSRHMAGQPVRIWCQTV